MRRAPGKRGILRSRRATGLVGESGISLVLVLWLLALVLLIAPGFVYTMRVESAATMSFRDEASAWALALAAINMAAAEAAGDYELVAAGNDGLVFLAKADKGYRPLAASRERSLGGGVARYEIEDERSRINLNIAERQAIYEALRLTGVAATERDMIADSVIDWRDDNHEFHLNGAEDDYYASLPSPYGSKDAPLDFAEEILLVRGMTPEIYYGSGKAPDWAGASGDNGFSGLDRVFTVHGDGKLNLNTASAAPLEATFGLAAAHEILLRRQTGYFELPERGGAVTSDTFRVRACGIYGAMAYSIEAVLLRKVGSREVVFLSWREQGAARC